MDVRLATQLVVPRSNAKDDVGTIRRRHHVLLVDCTTGASREPVLNNREFLLQGRHQRLVLETGKNRISRPSLSATRQT